MAELGSLPDRFVGVWQRRSIAVGDGAPFETHRVIWVQTELLYADLRVALPGCPDEPMSFAGMTTWQEPWLRWQHDLDLDPRADADQGQVRWDGDLLVESGTFATPDGPVAYTEVWERIADGSTLAQRTDGSILVAVGDHALRISDERPQGGEYRATYWVRVGSAWVPELVLGSPLDVPLELAGG